MNAATPRFDILLGRKVVIDICEPSSYAERDDNEREGMIRRILSGGLQSHAIFSFAIVEIERAWIHGGKPVTVVSIMARHSGHDLLDLGKGGSIGVNINTEPDWILDCPDDDPRIGEGKDSQYIGYGVARLLRANSGKA